MRHEAAVSLFEKTLSDQPTAGHLPEAPALPAGDPLVPYLRRRPAGLPALSELDVVRHFTRLSRLNFSVDTHFYPLGSCTMKYNPRLGEDAAALPGFAGLHPSQPEQELQGSLGLVHGLGKMLCHITGMDDWSPAPAAGAHGEFTGMALIRRYFRERGEERHVVLVPDSAHGTNPASARLAGFTVRTIPSGADGRVDPAALAEALSPDVAALMLTNPNTLGLFENGIGEIARLVHAAGGLLYYDGANLNAIAGIVRPGDMGFDVVHLNLHKTFATPHGGGGPGAGPVLCRERLSPFLPAPRILAEETPAGTVYRLDRAAGAPSIGMVRSGLGPFPVLVRAYAYLLCLGEAGVRRASLRAVLNANYLASRLAGDFEIPYGSACMHEFVASARAWKARNVSALDIAKALIDLGFHPPTVYFPLIVPEALMIEPTETESLAELDRFVEAMREIRRRIDGEPDWFHDCPRTTPVSRPDEVRAVKEPRLTG